MIDRATGSCRLLRTQTEKNLLVMNFIVNFITKNCSLFGDFELMIINT